MPRKKSAKRAYHSGSCFKNTPTSKTWTVSWREGDRREREGGFKSKSEGQAWLDGVVLPNLLAGKPGRPSGSELLSGSNLSVVVERWFKTRTVVSVDTERYNWRKHLQPTFGALRPDQLDSVRLAAWVRSRLTDTDLEDDEPEEEAVEGQLSPGTVTNIVRLVSTLYTDLIDQKIATQNPAKSLPKALKKRLKSDHDPKTTPFIRHLSTVFAIIRILPEPFNVAYAIGALAGLRTGEILGLDWESIDLSPTQRKIVVRQQVSKSKLRRPKSKKSRTVLIVDALYPLLLEYKKRTGGTGLLFRPVIKGWSAFASPHSTRKFTAQWNLSTGKRRKYVGGFDSMEEAEAFARLQAQAQPIRISTRGGTEDSKPRYMRYQTLHKAFRAALVQLGIPELEFYCATRHTFASQWVLNNGNMSMLQRLLGHHSITTTERYQHLSTDHFHEKDYQRLAVDSTYVPVAAAVPANNVTEMTVVPGALESYLDQNEADA